MPLKGGKSRHTVSTNIKALMHEWEADGRIGSSHPADRKHAQRQAVAIALDKAGVSRKRKPEKRAAPAARPRRTRTGRSR